MKIRRTLARWPLCTLLFPAALAAMLLTGCFESNTIECSGGVICPVGYACTADGNGCRPTSSTCGDGIMQPETEGCDDGNQIDEDDCRSDCQLNTCGDGKLDTQGPVTEACDELGGADSQTCNHDCSIPRCGDGLPNAAFTPPGAPRPEVCDDGGNVSGDGCSADCASDESCGDDYVNDDLPNTRANNPTLCLSATSDGTNCAEVCDDGNIVSGDGCSANCLSEEVCRNGILDAQGGPGNPIEHCDDGDLDDADECRNNCQSGFGCGNGIVDNDGPGGPQFDEECDNGLVVAGVPQDNAACDGDCTIPVCGDDRINLTVEDCDPGTIGADVDDCNADCTLPACGDGKLNDAFIPVGATTPEACDDGNTTAGDGCSAICHIETCGNGVTETINGEQCDDANFNDLDACRNNCQTPRCGDGVASAAETCDTSGNSVSCDFDCSLPVCGDGIINRTFMPVGSALTEACDDGNTVAGDGCDGLCRIETCGNGITEAINGEQCDDANFNDLDACRNNCQTPRCGDGIASTAPLEICDTSGDSLTCDFNCSLPLCGDGNINVPFGEQCDDGGVVSGDGCSSSCRIEPFTLAVTKTGTGTGTVTSLPAGITCGADCAESFPPGATVTLTAAPLPNSVFTGWSGAGCTGTGTCLVTMDAAKNAVAQFDLNTLTVTKSGTGTGAVTSAPGTINCGATCSNNFNAATVVVLTAAPVANSAFTGWTGGGCSGTGTCSVTMNGATAVNAIFTLNVLNLAVTKAGNGTGAVTSVPSGINCGATCTAGFNQDSLVTLTATPSANNTFTGWSGACTGTAACAVTMTTAQAVTATFTLNIHQLTVAKAGTGTGTVTSAPSGINCGATCSANYDAFTSVVLTANAATNNTFAGWTGGGCSGLGTCTVAVTAATTVTATFTLNSLALTVTPAGTGTGVVTSTPAGITCGATCSASFLAGSVITLVAVPTAGTSVFTSWSGAPGCTTSSTCVVTLTAATTVTATFAFDTHVLTVVKAGTGAGTVVSTTPAGGITCGVDCSDPYIHNTPVTLTATASSPDSTFTGWTGATGCTTASTCIVTVAAAQTVTATFTLTTPALTVVKNFPAGGTVNSVPGGIGCGATCSATFNYGSVIGLVATPAAGWTFTSWSGGGCSGSGLCFVTLTAATTVNANFTQNTYALTLTKTGAGTGSVTSAPAGITCAAGCATTSASFNSATSVVLTAVPSANNTFVGWSGAGCSGVGTCTVVMNQAETVTANFAITTFPISLVKTGAGTGLVTSSPAGINCAAGCASATASFNAAAVVTLTATATSTTSSFVGWTGACTGATCVITVSQADTAVANFALLPRTLTVTKAGNASATGAVTAVPTGLACAAGTSPCTQAYDHGQVVVLTPVAGTGSTFTSWSGGGCSGTGTCTVTMTAATAVTATFTLDTFALNVTKGGTGTGSVASAPAGISCGATCSHVYDYSLTPVVLTATPDVGQTFTGWSGTGITCPGTGTCSVTMTAARTVNANFGIASFALNVTVIGGGDVSSSPAGIACSPGPSGNCSQSFAYDTDVTLSANEDGGTFINWSGPGSGTCGTDPTCLVDMTVARNITANFTAP